jgi:hypothetical protein
MRKLITVAVFSLLVFGAVGPAEAGWEEGVQAFQSGNYSAAAKEFQAVVEASPDYANGHFMLGQALAKLNRDQSLLPGIAAANGVDAASWTQAHDGWNARIKADPGVASAFSAAYQAA